MRKYLREIIDAAWNAATESEEVPSTDWADNIIDGVDISSLETFYVCLYCHILAAGHPTRDPRGKCEDCGSTDLWEAVLIKKAE